MTVSASSFGSRMSNCSVPGSVSRQRLACACRCFRYSSRLPGAVLIVATIASLAIYLSPMCSSVRQTCEPKSFDEPCQILGTPIGEGFTDGGKPQIRAKPAELHQALT